MCLLLLLAGCATYDPLPLADNAAPRVSVEALRHPATLDPRAPLDAAEIAVLAVENNPELLAARSQRGVAEAEVLAAGVLPNPLLSASYGPMAIGSGNYISWTAGLTEDIRSLVTLSARRRSAVYAERQVAADLLWQEWQVTGKARLLYVDTVEGEKLLRLLHQARKLFGTRYARDRKALAAGNADLTIIASDLTALRDIDRQIQDLDRLQLTRRQALHALLGLVPGAELALSDKIELPALDLAAVPAMVADLPRRRPDLIALQLGYRSQEEKLRVAILEQFPPLNLGVSAANESATAWAAGPQVSFELPIFNRNQGGVAIESATRQRLHDEFTSRLVAARGEIAAMVAEISQLEQQLRTQEEARDDAEQVAAQAEKAYHMGNVDFRSYVDLFMTSTFAAEQSVGLEQSLFELRVAMATLLGAQMPTVMPSLPAPKGSS
jgi:outer membrane protein TolC